MNPELNAGVFNNANSDGVTQDPGVEIGTSSSGLSFVPQAQTVSVDDDAEIDIDDDDEEDDTNVAQQSGALAMFQKARGKRIHRNSTLLSNLMWRKLFCQITHYFSFCTTAANVSQ